MKHQYHLIYFAFILCLLSNSCQTTGNLVYGTNKSKIYSSKKEYISQNFSDRKINTNNVYILNEELFEQLSKEIINTKLSMYYGVADKYFVSGNQMTVKSCSGQFQTLYKKVGKDDSDLQKKSLDQNPILSSLNIDSNKKTAIFIYSYKMGTFANSKIFDIIDQLKNEEDFEYRVISIDNSDIKS